MRTLKLGSATRTISIAKAPMTVIRLNGQGGELDVIKLSDRNATVEAIGHAVRVLASRCSLAVGDTITITEEG